MKNILSVKNTNIEIYKENRIPFIDYTLEGKFNFKKLNKEQKQILLANNLEVDLENDLFHHFEYGALVRPLNISNPFSGAIFTKDELNSFPQFLEYIYNKIDEEDWFLECQNLGYQMMIGEGIPLSFELTKNNKLIPYDYCGCTLYCTNYQQILGKSLENEQKKLIKVDKK